MIFFGMNPTCILTRISSGVMQEKALKKGSIILVSFPFTDLSGEKRRPALAVAVSSDHCVALFITSRTQGDPSWHVPIEASDRTGLVLPSIIRCDKVASFDVRIVQGEVGTVSLATVKRVDAKLRQLLKL